MPNLKTITPSFLPVTVLLILSLTSCKDDTKRTEQSKAGAKPSQKIDEKAERLEEKAERLQDKAERTDLKAEQQREQDANRPTGITNEVDSSR